MTDIAGNNVEEGAQKEYVLRDGHLSARKRLDGRARDDASVVLIGRTCCRLSTSYPIQYRLRISIDTPEQ
jgi:hypothetical protein